MRFFRFLILTAVLSGAAVAQLQQGLVLRASGDYGLFFTETTTCVEYINAATECRGGDFSKDAGKGLNIELGYLPGLGMEIQLSATALTMNETSMFLISPGIALYSGWVNFNAVNIGLATSTLEVVNPKYDSTLAHYDWYDKNPTEALDGWFWRMELSGTIPIRTPYFKGIHWGIDYITLFNEIDMMDRLSLKLGAAFFNL